MHSVIFSFFIGTATINDMQRSMSGVLMTRAISLRSRMRGKLSRPVLKAGRRERSLLPSYQKREDGCHSPAQVPSWHKGTAYPESVLNRILFPTRYTPPQNQHRYTRFYPC